MEEGEEGVEEGAVVVGGGGEMGGVESAVDVGGRRAVVCVAAETSN